MTRLEVLSKAVSTYGPDAQMMMAVEEMAELTKALCKFKRHAGPEQIRDVLEEMADVRIMLDQLALMFGDCSEVEARKVERLEELNEALNKALSNSSAGLAVENEALRRERDAAVADLADESPCDKCKNCKSDNSCEHGKTGYCYGEYWQWRGAQEVKVHE